MSKRRRDERELKKNSTVIQYGATSLMCIDDVGAKPLGKGCVSMQQGTGSNERIGRRIELDCLKFRLLLKGAQPASNDDGTKFSSNLKIRWIVVWDAQSNSTGQLVCDSVFGFARDTVGPQDIIFSPMADIRPDKASRFEILHDEWWQPYHVQDQFLAGEGDLARHKWIKEWRRDIDLRGRMSVYEGDTRLAVQTGQIWLFAFMFGVHVDGNWRIIPAGPTSSSEGIVQTYGETSAGIDSIATLEYYDV